MPRKFLKDPIPKVHELREPITFLRSERTPGEGVGFTAVYTKYANAWARFNEGAISNLNGIQCQPFTGAKVTLRANPQLVHSIQDIIVWGKRCFRVLAVRPLDDERRWVVLTVREDVSLNSVDMLNSAKVTFVTEPPAATENPALPSTNNPYW